LRLSRTLYRIGLVKASTEVFNKLSEDLDNASLGSYCDCSSMLAILLRTMSKLEAIKLILDHQLEH
jgi:hypothetical protein